MAVTISGSTPTFSAATGYAGGVITSGTAVASTSGTSIDFTGIPSWVKRITVMFHTVSTSGTSIMQVQIGSGSITSTGYNAACSYTYSSGGSFTNSSTSAFLVIGNTMASTFSMSGSIVIANLSGNTWTEQGVLINTNGTPVSNSSAGSVALSGTLDRVRVTTVNGTDTFDAGSINILYE